MAAGQPHARQQRMQAAARAYEGLTSAGRVLCGSSMCTPHCARFPLDGRCALTRCDCGPAPLACTSCASMLHVAITPRPTLHLPPSANSRDTKSSFWQRLPLYRHDWKPAANLQARRQESRCAKVQSFGHVHLSSLVAQPRRSTAPEKMGRAVAKSNKRAWRKLDATAAQVRRLSSVSCGRGTDL